MQQLVTLHAKRVLLPELFKYLGDQTHTKFLFERELESYMACAFAKKQSAWLVMQRLADVFGAQWSGFGAGWRLAQPKSTQVSIQSYINEEQIVLRNQAYLRANALARLATRTKWMGTGSTVVKEPPEDETPKDWAERVIRDPAYYSAGLMFSRMPLFTGTFPKMDCPVNMLHSSWAAAYKLLNTTNERALSSNQCGPPSPLAPQLEGCQILVRALPWAGSIQAILVDGGSHRTEKPKRIVRYPRPTPELAGTRGGKWLLDWELMPSEAEEPALTKSVTITEHKATPFFGNPKGLEEYLEALADSTGIPVYSDAFRIPAEDKGLPNSEQPVASWLTAIKDSQHCFVKVKDGNVMVRHGGFWDLRLVEPYESMVQAMEHVSYPGLYEYADFAVALFPLNYSQTEFDLPFFETEQTPMLTFDPKPLCDSYLTLAAFGQWNEADRNEILRGTMKDIYKNVVDETTTETIQSTATARTGRGTTHFSVPVEVEHSQAVGWDRFVGPTSCLGEFYGGVPTGALEFKLLEETWMPGIYRDIWNDSPNDDPAFVKLNGPVKQYCGHKFGIKAMNNLSVITDDYGRPVRRFGRFTFFTAESGSDGVLNTVEIPDYSHHH